MFQDIFKILEIVKRNIFKHRITLNHGKQIRAEWLGELGVTKEYGTMTGYFEED